jgi:hypothetical protein
VRGLGGMGVGSPGDAGEAGGGAAGGDGRSWAGVAAGEGVRSRLTHGFLPIIFFESSLDVYFIKRRIRKFKVHQQLIRPIAAQIKQ